MNAIFLTLVSQSISACWIVLAVVLLRLLFKRAPKWISVLLWGIVAVRLICPLTIESALGLLPGVRILDPQTVAEGPKIATGFSAVNQAVQAVIQNPAVAASPGSDANIRNLVVPVCSAVWLAGVAGMLLYTAVSCFRVKRKIGTAVLLRDRIYQSENLASPFVYGVVKPKIYLPFNLSEADMVHVIAHEQAHICRKDHWWKPFGFLLLTLHWFNPVMWFAYVLLCRDIELACDERVIKTLSPAQKADYSQTLLACSVKRRTVAACPLAFGEVGAKSRVRSVLDYKKPKFWIILAALAACAVTAVCLLTAPYSASDDLKAAMERAILEQNEDATQAGLPTCAYDIYKVEKQGDKTVVYSWVLYEKYALNGNREAALTGSSTPVVFTFRSTGQEGPAAYQLLEYWIPKDGDEYAPSIKEKFPVTLWPGVFRQQEHISDLQIRCRKMVESTGDNPLIHTFTENPDGTFTADNGRTYRYKLELVGRSPNAACDSCYIVLTDQPDLTFERVNESVFTSNTERFLHPDEGVIIGMR